MAQREAEAVPVPWGRFCLSEKPSRRNKIESVISGGVYAGNDTSHERQSDFFTRNRGLSFVQPFSKKRLVNFN